MKANYLVGIDESGRGPLAGPVAVGAVILYSPRHIRLFRDVRDSKKSNAAQRAKWFLKIKEARKSGLLDFAVSFSNHSVIDKKGIMHAINNALCRSLKKCAPCLRAVPASPCGRQAMRRQAEPKRIKILLDGGLKAPEKYSNQKTIIRGDETETIIAMASIVAKVTRDKKMIAYAKKYPHYGFEKHKGYGTWKHRAAIKKYGVCKIHRQSFCRYL